MPTWLAGMSSEVTGYCDPFNLTGDGVAFSPDSQEGDATTFLGDISPGDTVRVELDGSNYREGVVDSIGEVGAHWELTWASVTVVGAFDEEDLLTVTNLGGVPPPEATIAVSSNAIAENAGAATVSVLLDAAAGGDVTIGFGFSGSATLNTDYSRTTNSIVIVTGQTSGSIVVTSINDEAHDNNETIIVGINSADGATIGTPFSASITILNDDQIGGYSRSLIDMGLITQNQTSEPLLFLLVDETDNVTPITGATPTVTISKNGGSFASPAGAVSEIGNGLYKVAANATDANTLGPLALHATATGANPVDVVYQVVAANFRDAVRLGLTGLPNATAGANGGLVLSNGGNSGTLVLGSGGVVSLATSVWPTNFTSLVISGAGKVTVGTNEDKTGYSLSGTNAPTLTQIIDGVAAQVTTDHGSGSYGTADVSALATTTQLANSSAALLAAVPSVAGIAASVASVVTADHGSGSYGTANVSALATAAQLGASSANLLSGINALPTLAGIASTVSAAVTADHGSGDYTTANTSALATTAQLGASSAALLSAVNSLPTVAAIWSRVTTNTGLSVEKVLEVAGAMTAGKVSGAGTNTETFKHLNSTVSAVVVTADTSGNRSAVTIS